MVKYLRLQAVDVLEFIEIKQRLICRPISSSSIGS